MIFKVHLRAMLGVNPQAFFRWAIHARLGENFKRAICKRGDLLFINDVKMFDGTDGLEQRGLGEHVYANS